MTQAEKAALFARLHVKGNPLVLYNAWDAGSARAILEAGAKAIATSSWAIAAAHGYPDGEATPLGFLQQIVARIAATIDAPVSADFEGGYSETESGIAQNISPLLDAQIIGINFEDRRVNGDGLYPIDQHAKRIAAIRHAARRKGVELFINARSDVFFRGGNPAELMPEAIARASAYAAAGASGFFVPGLIDEALIGHLCDATELPVNVMMMDGLPATARLSSLGVARISYGPIPYLHAMKSLKEQAPFR